MLSFCKAIIRCWTNVGNIVFSQHYVNKVVFWYAPTATWLTWQKSFPTSLMCLYFRCSKVVSVDHNKPIIVPAGQDSLSQIGESALLSLLLSRHPAKICLAHPRVLMVSYVPAQQIVSFCRASETFSASASIWVFFSLFHLKPLCMFLCSTLPQV